jgi:Flp pilus assembly protein TadG
MRAIQSPLRTLLQAWVRFARARSGNIAITFAIALIPLLAFVGAAIDYSRANALKASLQSALDSTALMVSKSAASKDSTALQTSADTYFRALFQRPDARTSRFPSAIPAPAAPPS